MASSTAAPLSTGSAPGRPRQTGQTLLFGCAPKLVGQPQKIFVAVASWTCTSRPMTGSYLAISSGPARSTNADDMLLYYRGGRWGGFSMLNRQVAQTANAVLDDHDCACIERDVVRSQDLKHTRSNRLGSLIARPDQNHTRDTTARSEEHTS